MIFNVLSGQENHVISSDELKSSLVVIKRIIKYIPKSQYMNIYNSLFISHLTYGISAWGGIPHYISWQNYLQSKNVVLVSCLVKEYHSTMLNIIKLVQDQGLFRST